jgi:hypothetical protein
MALDPLQVHIARIALALPEARTLALAGGGAMIVHGFVDRATKDIDLFTEMDAGEALTVAAALRTALTTAGFLVQQATKPPHENRFIALEPTSGHAIQVEIFPDGGRLRPRVVMDIGPVLHHDDITADKTLALWARAEPRDFVDVVALREKYGGRRLLELAAEKDRGFTVPTFVDALRMIRRITPNRWKAAGISTERAAEIERIVENWCAELIDRS